MNGAPHSLESKLSIPCGRMLGVSLLMMLYVSLMQSVQSAVGGIVLAPVRISVMEETRLSSVNVPVTVSMFFSVCVKHNWLTRVLVETANASVGARHKTVGNGLLEAEHLPECWVHRLDGIGKF